MSDETPTPRLTHLGKSSLQEAKDDALSLRAAQRAWSMPTSRADMDRANALGDYASLAEHYIVRFKMWSDQAVAYDVKSRELKAWTALHAAIAAELEP